MTDVNTIEMIKKHEGLRLKPYKCTAGKLTIGYGRNLEDKGITEKEATEMLMADIIDCVNDLNKHLPWYSKLSHNRQAVLIDMCFNLGITKLKRFKTTLDCIEKGNYGEASVQMLKSLWAKQVGQRAKTLSELMRIG